MNRLQDEQRRELLDRYRDEVGPDALERQQAHAAAGRCPLCWAPSDEPHSTLCPNRPEDEEAAQPTQEEGLF